MTASVIVLSREVNAGVDDVWTVLTDAERSSQMMDGVRDLEMVTTDPPQHAVMSGTLHHDFHHDPVMMSIAVTPHGTHDTTRLVMTMREDIKHRSLMGQAIWHTWGMVEYAMDRRLMMKDLEEIAHVAEARARSAA